ncbi:MAG: tetratricopeptide repeat protein [Helicobacteraceae bacterium]|jgi:tetratricopeptide (TPR) repeat protein|nr:tetratricopeptide repeat protein [Helicobacteraceae bacterium]
MFRLICAALFAVCVAFAGFYSDNAEAERTFLHGIGAESEKNYIQAIAYYTRAINIDPDLEIAFYSRGYTYAKLGDYSKAIADYTQAIKVAPHYAVAFNSRGNAYRDLGDYKQAIADYTQAIKVAPHYIEAYNNRTRAYAKLSDYKSATQDARKACELGDCKLLAQLGKKKLIRD